MFVLKVCESGNGKNDAIGILPLWCLYYLSRYEFSVSLVN